MYLFQICFPRCVCPGVGLLSYMAVLFPVFKEISTVFSVLAVLVAFPPTATQVQILRYSTKVQTWLGLCFVPVPGPSSSGDQVLGKHRRPQLKAVTYLLPRPSRSVFWVYNWRAFSGVPCVFSGELISGCEPPGRRRPSRIPRSLG